MQPACVQGEFTGAARAVDFFTSETAEISLQVHCGVFPDRMDDKPTFETKQGWQLFHSGDRRIIKTSTVTQNPYLLGDFSRDFRSGKIYVAENQKEPGRFIFPLSYPMGELFMMSLLGTGLGILSHAAGVIYDGQGYLFTGNGGAGKTTTARLWESLPGASVVNDDKVILRKVDGQFRLYGTPWHGEGGMALPQWAPLKRVFILKKALHNGTKPLSTIEATTGMVRRAFIPLWEREAMNFILGFLEELSQNVECLELLFVPHPSAVEHVLNLPD